MRQALMSLDGVVEASVSYDDKRADVRYQPDIVEPSALIAAIHDVGFSASLTENDRGHS